MAITEMHPEDVKAELRKRFRSVAAFERAHGLPEKSVTDVLRGQKSKRVSDAVEAAIKVPVPTQSEHSGRIADSGALHRLNAEVR